MYTSVLHLYASKDVNQQSPVRDDYERVVKHDSDGNESVTYRKVDYKELQKSLGSVAMWSLDALLKAGISPDFAIHTGLGTRLDGVSSVERFEEQAEKILSETTPNS